MVCSEEVIDNTQLNTLYDTIKIRNRQLTTLKQQKEKPYDLLEQGVYDNDTFLNRMNTISSKIDTDIKEINKLNNRIEKLSNNTNIKKHILPQIMTR